MEEEDEATPFQTPDPKERSRSLTPGVAQGRRTHSPGVGIPRQVATPTPPALANVTGGGQVTDDEAVSRSPLLRHSHHSTGTSTASNPNLSHQQLPLHANNHQHGGGGGDAEGRMEMEAASFLRLTTYYRNLALLVMVLGGLGAAAGCLTVVLVLAGPRATLYTLAPIINGIVGVLVGVLAYMDYKELSRVKDPDKRSKVCGVVLNCFLIMTCLGVCLVILTMTSIACMADTSIHSYCHYSSSSSHIVSVVDYILNLFLALAVAALSLLLLWNFRIFCSKPRTGNRELELRMTNIQAPIGPGQTLNQSQSHLRNASPNHNPIQNHIGVAKPVPHHGNQFSGQQQQGKHNPMMAPPSVVKPVPLHKGQMSGHHRQLSGGGQFHPSEQFNGHGLTRGHSPLPHLSPVQLPSPHFPPVPVERSRPDIGNWDTKSTRSDPYGPTVYRHHGFHPAYVAHHPKQGQFPPGQGQFVFRKYAESEGGGRLRTYSDHRRRNFGSAYSDISGHRGTRFAHSLAHAYSTAGHHSIVQPPIIRNNHIYYPYEIIPPTDSDFEHGIKVYPPL